MSPVVSPVVSPAIRSRQCLRIVAAAAAVSSVLLVGCGGDDDAATVTDASATSDAPPAATTAPTPDTTSPAARGSTSAAQTTAPDATTPATTAAPVPTGDAPDPCSLLTAADLQAATGVSFGEGVFNAAMSNGPQSICDWVSSGSEFATAQVLIVAGSGGDLADAAAGASQVSPTSAVDVAGADAAYQTEEGSLLGMSLHGDFVQVAYIPPGPGNVNDATLALAAVVVANYP